MISKRQPTAPRLKLLVASALLALTPSLTHAGEALAPSPQAAERAGSSAEQLVLDPAVDAYFQQALKLMRTQALNSDRVDWPRLEQQLRTQLVGAESSIETYPALRQALAALNDSHSFLQLPDALEAADAHWQASKQADRARTPASASPPSDASAAPASALVFRRGSQLEILRSSPAAPPVALINVAAHLEQTGLDGAAARLAGLIESAAQAGVEDWVVDLRGNGGGNVFPMLAGMAALLGEGDMVQAHTKDGRRMSFRLQQGVASLQSLEGKTEAVCRAPWPLKAQARVRRLAVLIDRYTGSSGEMLAMALRPLPHSRFFGERSAGATTATDGFRLPDGANLVLAIAHNRDRLGQAYPRGVDVDEAAPLQTELLPGLQDRGVQQALHWLLAAR